MRLANLENGERFSEPDATVSLLDLVPVLSRRKFWITGVSLLAMAVAAPIVLLIPVSYTAEAVIMPPQQEQSSQSMMLPLSGLAGLGAASLAPGLLRNPADMYIGMLKSRTIADSLIARFHLQQLYRCKTLTDTRKALSRHADITTGKDLLIRIGVDDHDRTRAAALANAYVDELHKQNSRLVVTAASVRRAFFERRLAEEKDALANAETALRNNQQSSGLIFPPGQSEALIRSTAQLRAEIAAREVELQGMRSYATSENPQVQMLEREITAERAQLEKLEGDNGGLGGTAVSARRLPEAGIQQIRKLRDLKYHEALFELLARQYEAARIDEARLAPVISVVDSATPPDKKSWPPRTLLVLLSGLAAALAACSFVLIKGHA